MGTEKAQELTLEKAIGQAGGVLEECQTCLVAILNRLGFSPAQTKPGAEGQSRGESTLADRIGEVCVLEDVGRTVLNDLRRVEHELRHL